MLYYTLVSFNLFCYECLPILIYEIVTVILKCPQDPLIHFQALPSLFSYTLITCSAKASIETLQANVEQSSVENFLICTPIHKEKQYIKKDHLKLNIIVFILFLPCFLFL
jgi:hypothetical protein